MPIDFTFTRRIELDVPRYDLKTIDNVQVDAVATEWQDIPAIRIGPNQPVPRGRKHFSGADDLEADLRLAVSKTMLHVFVDVRDPDFVDNGKDSYFLSDSFNLVLQAPPWQPQAAVPTILAFGASGRATPNVPHRVVRRDGEASIPLAALPFAKRNEGPLEAQFEVVLVDRDPGQDPSLHRLWTNHLRANVADYGSLRVLVK
ncbi:MAG TPA: hypothetical protein EYP98_20190 [Planctomycetes bacterium]|nr:hypothetical protein [Planctomycetota bacterium]